MTTYDTLLERIASQRRRWLITGVAGFIGSHLLETLLAQGQTVTGLDNFSTGSTRNLDLVRAQVGERRWRGFRLIEGDIRRLDVCRAACADVDVVLHQAALGSVPRSIDDPLASNDNNVDGFLNLLVAARDAGAPRVVYASSSATYGDDPGLPKVEARIGRPLSPYAVTKYVNELYAGVFARAYGLDSVGLRYFNVFGPRQKTDGAYAAVIPTWVSALLAGEPVYINGDGRTARDFCYVDNAVQANLLAATVDAPAALNQVYNVAVNAQTSLTELFELIRARIGLHHPRLLAAQPRFRDARPGDMRFSRADIGKAGRLLGYQPVCRVREGLERTIDWYVTQHAPPAAAGAARPAPALAGAG